MDEKTFLAVMDGTCVPEKPSGDAEPESSESDPE